MKFISCLSTVVTCLTLLVGLINAAGSSSHSGDTAPSHLRSSGRFYRAVYKQDIQNIGTIYKKGQSPSHHGEDAGDFSTHGVGGFYVFDNEQETRTWGRCYSAGTRFKTYHVTTFQYMPYRNLKIKFFPKADTKWLRFVEYNYASTKKDRPYDIVEGPISAPSKDKRDKTIKVGFANDDGRLVWQAAFISDKAMKTLVMTDIKEYPVSNNQDLLKCCQNCVIQ